MPGSPSSGVSLIRQMRGGRTGLLDLSNELLLVVILGLDAQHVALLDMCCSGHLLRSNPALQETLRQWHMPSCIVRPQHIVSQRHSIGVLSNHSTCSAFTLVALRFLAPATGFSCQRLLVRLSRNFHNRGWRPLALSVTWPPPASEHHLEAAARSPR